VKRLWICGVWRVAIVAAYLAIAFVDESLASDPFVYPTIIALTLAVIAYDVIERRHRA
jgi:hypothetical protein